MKKQRKWKVSVNETDEKGIPMNNHVFQSCDFVDVNYD